MTNDQILSAGRLHERAAADLIAQNNAWIDHITNGAEVCRLVFTGTVAVGLADENESTHELGTKTWYSVSDEVEGMVWNGWICQDTESSHGYDYAIAELLEGEMDNELQIVWQSE